MLAPSFGPSPVLDIMYLYLGKIPRLRVATPGKLVSDVGGLKLKENVSSDPIYLDNMNLN